MDHAEVLARYDREMRAGARPDGPGSRIERTGRLVRQTGPAHGWNGILWSGLDADGADEAIEEQKTHFTGLGLAFEWKVYGHDRPADLARRLVAAGFTPEAEETLMAAETAAVPLGTGAPEGVHILPVTDAAGAGLVADVHEQAFGTDGTRLRQRLLDQLAATPDTVVAVLALAGGTPVAAARMELVPGTAFAGLWGGGTVPAWRRRGVYRALVAHRARIAADRGYRYLQVDASDDSRPVLQRLGFAPLTTTTPYVHLP
ncbi:GNAT family N-acetyltransferase [Streptomyces actuosus]|uniref:GNAT family N-acetyltransferase n=1 Tax=Streptomyces actuosus TaxID=1885 RepID=A0ABS2VKZ7_STRAS|nr:GNAT family N-acetyltransferase [Streptomyces actuosus]MBN0043772.1 GNAT family N-acetyltransferase [Streptomyces actuosus]